MIYLEKQNINKYLLEMNLSTLDKNIVLPWPEDLVFDNLTSVDKLKLCQILNLFEQAVDEPLYQDSIAKINQALNMLGSIETFSTKEYFFVTNSLKKEEIEDYDNYFEIKRVQTKAPSAYLIVKSMLVAYKTFAIVKYSEIESQANLIDLSDSLLVWKKYHWLFFIFSQGSVICILLLKREMRKRNIIQTGSILKAMAQLMLASAASMFSAASFDRKHYDEEVRPTMMTPHVNSTDFSGLMSYDHAYLVNLWKKEQALFKSLDRFLNIQYKEFLSAYGFLASAHKSICQKYGGDEAGSLRDEKTTALNSLEKITASRTKIFNNNIQLPQTDRCFKPIQENEYEQLIKTGFKYYSQLLNKSFNL